MVVSASIVGKIFINHHHRNDDYDDDHNVMMIYDVIFFLDKLNELLSYQKYPNFASLKNSATLFSYRKCPCLSNLLSNERARSPPSPIIYVCI